MEITSVEVDAFVIVRIVQHCRDGWPELVTGQLLGLDRDDGVLEVTSSFPTPAADVEAEDAEQAGQEYQMEMMRCLREVNVDHNTVGWYSSALMGSFLNETTIETQSKFQDTFKKSVLLIYDPLKTSQGLLSLRALRLSAAFMELYRSQSFTKESITKAGLSFDALYEEVPLKIHHSSLAGALLADLPLAGAEVERLDMPPAPFLEKHVEYVVGCLEDLSLEQSKLHYFQRNLQRQVAQQAAWIQKRKAENAARKHNGEEPLPESDPNNPIFKPLPEPPHLDSLLIENHIDLFCTQLNRHASESLAKLHLLETLLSQ